MPVDPLEEGIAEDQVPLELPVSEESIAPLAPASSTTTPSPSSEEPPASEEEPPASEEEPPASEEPPPLEEAPPSEEEPTIWDSVFDKWHVGNQLWMMTYGGGPVGGNIIDYSSRPRAVSRWHRRIGQTTITPLPDGVHLLYMEWHEDEPQAHVCEFTVEQVETMDLEALDYMCAAELYEDIWEDVPGEGDSPESPPSPGFAQCTK